MKSYFQMTPEEREEYKKQVAERMAQHQNEDWVTVQDPDGAVMSMPRSQYEKWQAQEQAKKQQEAEQRQSAEDFLNEVVQNFRRQRPDAPEELVEEYRSLIYGYGKPGESMEEKLARRDRCRQIWKETTPIIQDGKTLDQLVAGNQYLERLVERGRLEGLTDKEIWDSLD